jgi:hypothetical protein
MTAVMPEQVHEGVGAIVHMQEFLVRRAGALAVAGERRSAEPNRSPGDNFDLESGP